jgi:hypothetical protein
MLEIYRKGDARLGKLLVPRLVIEWSGERIERRAIGLLRKEWDWDAAKGD